MPIQNAPNRDNMHNLHPPAFREFPSYMIMDTDDMSYETLYNVQEFPSLGDPHSDMRLDIDGMSYEANVVVGDVKAEKEAEGGYLLRNLVGEVIEGEIEENSNRKYLEDVHREEKRHREDLGWFAWWLVLPLQRGKEEVFKALRRTEQIVESLTPWLELVVIRERVEIGWETR
ncbi:uncharacterized protein HKW66_Vig0229800 [Vigna angularis]|uniref:Uncharacterized protein n=1 Tax=Phaseolus angularis TaxID=3914 RepID=A0A8T0KF03_PHAAN|nr:uncharacterized protein HKW66_Vig0229800 [Vigna angularis]